MLSKGHVQPHHNNVPRRRQRTRSPPNGSAHMKSKPSSVPPPEVRSWASPPKESSVGDSTGSTRSTVSSTTLGEDRGERPSPRTPLTCPSDAGCLPANILDPDKFPPSIPLVERLSPNLVLGATCDNEPTSPLGILLPPGPSPFTLPHATSNAHELSNTAQISQVAVDGARGHLEPRAANVPRRLSRAQRERERARRRCLQEVIVGSRVWIAFDSTSGCAGLADDNDDDDDDDEDDRDLTSEERKERDWMWDSEGKFGFSGVIRVRVGRRHGDCLRRRNFIKRDKDGNTEIKDVLEEGEEIELVIGKEQAKAYDDSGISALTNLQLEAAASFLVTHRRKKNGSGKVLITVPPSRSVEALSIALFALALPSTSLTSPYYPHSPSYLSRLRFLPGILELEQSQDVDVVDITGPESGSDGPTDQIRDSNPRYTLIQLALWHLHDLTIPVVGYDQDSGGGLKLEWRGALSSDGVERLENLVSSR